MGRYSGSKPAAQRNGVNPLWVGILVGIVIGAGIAAVFTWYRMKAPSPFLQKEQPVELPKIPAELSVAVPAATPENNGKPRFEFYNVLTDKESKTSSSSTKSAVKERQAVKQRPVDTKPVDVVTPSFEPRILQVGSFSKAEDAEKYKAKLALIGAESHVESAAVPEKGVYYRVRLGPYSTESELNRMRDFLKQNGIESTPMRAQ